MGRGYEERLTVVRKGDGEGGGVGTEEEAKSHDAPTLVWDHESTSQLQQRQRRDNEAVQQHGEETALTVQRPLVDPLYNDLDRDSRYYLYHFATQLCEVMVVYDMPGQNPIRDIIPATSAYPLLLQILIANSAFHVFNISNNPMDHSSYQSEQNPTVMAYYQAVSRFGGPLKSAYKDALVAKQKALELLAQHIASVNETNIDLILVTILMFVNYALVESGRDKWKVHMDGALNLIKRLGEPPYLQRPMSRLRQTILSDFLVFYILGSTFTFTTLPGFVPDTIELEPILRYTETNNYLSCPGPLLRIMLESFALPYSGDALPGTEVQEGVQEEIQQMLASLIQRALDFDPISWSCEFEPTSPTEDIQKRIHMAAAHRSAVCIYLARVLPSRNPLVDPSSGDALVNMKVLADDIVDQISYLKPSDPLFKSICWPLFLAGAESEDKEQREWIVNTLDQLYSIMFWGYLHTSKRVLLAIWKFKDRVGSSKENCWVEEVKHLGNEILIA